MDIALVLLLPLVGGHVFATNFLCSRFRVAREGGSRLYFSAIFYGAFCFICALLIRLWLIAHPTILSLYDSQTGEAALQFLLKHDEQQTEYSVVLVALFAFGIGVTGWFPLNFTFRFIWLVLRVIGNWREISWWRDAWIELELPPWLWHAVKFDDLSSIIYIAALRPKPVCITLDNRKVYIGYVIQTPDPCLELKAISIFPLISGYRDNSTGELRITTRYDDVYNQILGNKNSNIGLTSDDFRTVLPMHRVCSINLFDVIAYSHFMKSKKPNKTAAKTTKKAAR